LTITVVDRDLAVAIPTGTLHLSVRRGPEVRELCDFAARDNPLRGFLIVSRVLGRHLPARPEVMRATMAGIAAQVPADLPGPVLFVGMAETATALGQGVFAAWRARHRRHDCLYLQSARQRVAGARLLASFEEGHSHATTHLVQVADVAAEAAVRATRSLVIVDDEASTGRTMVAAAEALAPLMPALERIEIGSITDWSGGGYLAELPRPAAARSILAGSMRWEPGTPAPARPEQRSGNRAGVAPPLGMRARTGLRAPEAAVRTEVSARAGERILVLGDGEHSYEALLIAEEVERQGAISAVQSITRSPALPGGAIASVTPFDDAYGSGAPCYLYNILAHRPDRIVIAAEIAGTQVERARKGAKALGRDLPVDLVLCGYEQEDVA
jgi:hypothetical protein